MKAHFVGAVYWVTVFSCLAVQGGVEGDANDALWVALFLLTVPWSLVPLYFTWALMHGGVGVGFLVGMVIVFAVLNSFIMYRVARWVDRRARSVGV
jgi:hypothetical protein